MYSVVDLGYCSISHYTSHISSDDDQDNLPLIGKVALFWKGGSCDLMKSEKH